MKIIMRLCRNRFVPLILCVLVLLIDSSAQAQDEYTKARQGMIKDIEADVRLTSFYINKKELDPKVMDAMRKVPRHEFVPRQERREAYENRPLPIGHGQTISQPYIVALMTDLLEPKRQHKVLEVGTGSGYQAAILAELVAEVFTIEIIEPLGKAGYQVIKKAVTPVNKGIFVFLAFHIILNCVHDITCSVDLVIISEGVDHLVKICPMQIGIC